MESADDGSAGDGEVSPSANAFAVVRHGFDRNQVREHVAGLEADLRTINSDRDAALSQVAALNSALNTARSEIEILRKRVEELCRPVEAPDDLHDRLRAIVNVSRAEAAEITARAQSAAEQTWTRAESAANAFREGYERLLEDLRAREAEFRAEHAAALREARAGTERMAEDAEHRRSALGEQVEAEYQRIEREFQESMTLRRAALDSEITERHEASVAEAQRLVREATEEATRRTDGANQRVRELNSLRIRVSERLQETSMLLARSTSLLEQDELEDEIISGNPGRGDGGQGGSRAVADPAGDAQQS